MYIHICKVICIKSIYTTKIIVPHIIFNLFIKSYVHIHTYVYIHVSYIIRKDLLCLIVKIIGSILYLYNNITNYNTETGFGRMGVSNTRELNEKKMHMMFSIVLFVRIVDRQVNQVGKSVRPFINLIIYVW